MKKPTTILKESVSEYREFVQLRLRKRVVGTRELRVPRARVRDEETGETTEFRSELLPRYARRTREVDEALLGTLSIIIICPGLDSRPGLPLSTCWRAWSGREGRC